MANSKFLDDESLRGNQPNTLCRSCGFIYSYCFRIKQQPSRNRSSQSWLPCLIVRIIYESNRLVAIIVQILSRCLSCALTKACTAAPLAFYMSYMDVESFKSMQHVAIFTRRSMLTLACCASTYNEAFLSLLPSHQPSSTVANILQSRTLGGMNETYWMRGATGVFILVNGYDNILDDLVD